MHEAHGWMLSARATEIFLAAWFVVVVVYGFWRSRGAAKQDPIRESGPIL